MTAQMKPKVLKRLVLGAETAADLMTPNPVSIHEQATVPEAAAWLTDLEISAAPVIDDAGRPVGVLSRTDIVRHDREIPAFVYSGSDYGADSELGVGTENWKRNGFHIEAPDCTEVRDIMTPTVISVRSGDSALDVVAKILAMKIHRVFVVDSYGVLVGVISTFDVLRHLHYEE